MKRNRLRTNPIPRTITEPEIVKQQLKPNYFGAIAVLLLIIALTVGLVLLLFYNTPGWHRDIFTDEEYYCSSFFTKAHGVVQLDGKALCFTSDGALAHGVFDVDGRRCIADEDGAAVNGELILDGSLYVAQNGVLLCEFKSVGEGTYEPVDAPALTDGALVLANERYTLVDGLLHRGIIERDGSRYGYDEYGNAVSGAVVMDGQTYLFSETGRLLTNARRNGWVSDENGFASKAAMLAAAGSGVMANQQSYEPSPQLSAKIDEIVSDIENSSTDGRQVIRAAYDKVRELLYWGNENTDMSGNFSDKLELAAESALERGDGRSQHYAALTYYILNRLGYQTIVVKGECIIPYGEFRESYWCMTALEDGWYHLDPYCEDYDEQYECYLVCDEDIKGISHEWADGTLPESAKKAD